jgi:7-cyano-7-deazaguanine synthase
MSEPAGARTPPRRAVCLLSGGLDSATAAAIACAEGYELHALTVDYGQRHELELLAAREVAAALGVVEHKVLRFDLRPIGGSSLTDEIPVPREEPEGIPNTYVPARNTILLALALGWAETLRIGDIFIGVNAVDYSGYPDCRPEFIAAFEELANRAVWFAVSGEGRIRIHAPLIALSKAEIIRRGLALGLDYGLTWSCYDPTPDRRPCGVCPSCRIRQRGFAEAGAEDPAAGRPFAAGASPPAGRDP